MTLLASFIQQLKGLNIQTDSLPTGVMPAVHNTTRLRNNDSHSDCGDCNDCDCKCDCQCQCQCGKG